MSFTSCRDCGERWSIHGKECRPWIRVVPAVAVVRAAEMIDTNCVFNRREFERVADYAAIIERETGFSAKVAVLTRLAGGDLSAAECQQLAATALRDAGK